jgi:YidC/Oxa1 family membrane protein insertase
MEQKRLFLAIAMSLAIVLGFQMVYERFLPHPTPQTATITETTPHGARKVTVPARPPQPSQTVGVAPSDAGVAPVGPVKAGPRLAISAPQVEGSINLVGARLDSLVLRDYHETIKPDSPLVRLLEPRGDPQPYYVQFGWTAGADTHVALPGPDTVWKASAPTLGPAEPVTLSWNNGQGLTFQIILSVDDHYMFTVQQRVANDSGKPVALYPWSRIRRDYTPETAGYYILHEGLIGVLKDRLQEQTYSSARSEADKHDGVAFQESDKGGWAGITDKYWLTALIPDQATPVTSTWHALKEGRSGHAYQVDFVPDSPEQIAPGGTATETTRLFAGAKVVSLLDQYEIAYNIPHFDKAVDFGWFYFLTKPIFLCLDWLYHLLGNFGLAILVFTVFVKALFFPLANKSYKSMSKMRLLGPKLQGLRERYKDDPAKMQQEMMAIYKAEGVNPASGCLPMLIQVPVFFSLYKVIFVTIEMRHAPFFGWIHDLSAADPTNLFNLFGLLPFHPSTISPFLHLGAWPLIMGFTMWLQQRLNPPPPDPTQAKLFQFMPVIFTFMLARFPAGLVIYWTWNNLLSVAQQWLIMRNTRLEQQRTKVLRPTT